MSALGLFILITLGMEIGKIWRLTGGKAKELLSLGPNARAVGDTLRLKYLDGGGHGCNYPDDRFSMTRRYFHHLVFYGFALCFAATAVAAFYDHFLSWPAPYPYLSWPVGLGTVGGVALLIGTAGMLYLKWMMDRAPAASQSLGMDVAFTGQLFLTSLTGLLVLFFRETTAMGVLLAIHLGVVIAFFICLPYGKFVHSIYRYASLVRNAIEQSRGKA
jgi:citrate/tricarballylate utilization protein